jgi:ketosteroid isomerase-like protein
VDDVSAGDAQLEQAVRELQDRLDVTELVVRCAHAQDARDWDQLAGVYADDAVYAHPGGRLEGAAAIVDRSRRALSGLDASQHLIGSISVSVHGHSASSFAYFQAQHVRTGAEGGELYTVGGSYADRHVRTPSGWRIAERNQTYHWRTGNRDVVAR